jgi:hypothetical protein
MKFIIFYFGLYLLWGLTFGYLRYGLVLEMLGGLIILIWFYEIVGIKKYFVLIPLLIVLILQGKRIVNLSLAYDISFRPGYFYNRQSYPKEFSKLFINKILVNKDLINKYSPNVYLNCTIPNLTYYVMSDFTSLPVANIDTVAYVDMTNKDIYNKAVLSNLTKKIGTNKLRFVTITAKKGLNIQYNNCVANLKKQKFNILEEVEIDNFLGYQGQGLVVIIGQL